MFLSVLQLAGNDTNAQENIYSEIGTAVAVCTEWMWS